MSLTNFVLVFLFGNMIALHKVLSIELYTILYHEMHTTYVKKFLCVSFLLKKLRESFFCASINKSSGKLMLKKFDATITWGQYQEMDNFKFF